jgi:hypothetical protein
MQKQKKGHLGARRPQKKTDVFVQERRENNGLVQLVVLKETTHRLRVLHTT